MTRIIAGEFKGRQLQVPPSGTRPTSDRVREAVFSALVSQGVLDGATVLDLFAGSGALGFEALSRGAAHLTAVDCSRAATRVIAANARALGIRVEVAQAEAGRFLRRASRGFDLVFLDPPYDQGVDQVLELLACGQADVTGGTAGWLAPGAVVVVERAARAADPLFPEGFGAVEQRRYGETVVWIAHWEGTADYS